MDNHQLSMPNWGDRNWSILPKELMEIKQRVEKAGTPLNHPTWDLKINYGIKTGYNEAFIIDTTTKERLIAEDPKSADILYPILRGKDIDAYAPNFQGLWLIFTRRGIDIEKYQAIKRHLLEFKEVLTPKQDRSQKVGRKPGPYQWYEIQDAVAYWQDFEKPKIIYPNMTKYVPFAFDQGDRFFTNQKCFILTGSHLEYLTIVLNSTLFKVFFKDEFPELLGDTYELSKVFFDKLPIKEASKRHEMAFIRLCEYLVAVQKQCLGGEGGEKWGQLLVRLQYLADAAVWEHYFSKDVKGVGAHSLALIQKDFPELPDSEFGIIEALEKVNRLLANPEVELIKVLTSMDSLPEFTAILRYMHKSPYSTIFNH